MAEQTELRQVKNKPRVFVTSDIANEPDDAQSLVRYLLYCNEFDTKGIVACTSTHMKRRVCPEDMVTIINAYGKVVKSLNAHTHPSNQYPSAESLLKLVTTGPALYGAEALEPGVPPSDGAKLLIKSLEQSTDPLWVICWGGSNVLAQALHLIRQTRSEARSITLRSRLRVYTISDQDDTGLCIRTTFPDIFYICSLHGWNQYLLAAWTGISGQIDGERAADPTKFTKEWIKENIQIGPLGSVYPDTMFLTEGDTATFLYLIQNGLGHPEHPEWGSWGGRYLPVDLRLASRHYSDAVDRVIGADGKPYTTNYATVWRWRDAYQNDFAARMQWTLTGDITAANHAPVVIVNDSSGPEPLMVEVEVGNTLHLDCSKSYDPDGDELTFNWFQYREVTVSTMALIDPQVPDIAIENLDTECPGRQVKLEMPVADKCAMDFVPGKALEKGEQLHFVLEVKDNGSPRLTTYKRVVVQIVNPRMEGGRDVVTATTVEWMQLMMLL